MTKLSPSSIRIECRGADLLHLDAIEEFQGNLKNDAMGDEDFREAVVKRNGEVINA
jgi:hypothetical protein